MAQLGKVRSVSNIKSDLLRPATTSIFEVEIPIPNGGGGLRTNDKLNLMCTEASLPGSSLATMEINNNYVGVTERYAHRRIFDDRMDFTFFIDAKEYLPIKFFESWIKYVVNEPDSESSDDAKSKAYHYELNYPDTYVADQGLKIRKFERDRRQQIEYEFIRAYPIQITSMPVSYDASSLLKCTVSMTYLRYLIVDSLKAVDPVSLPNPVAGVSVSNPLAPFVATMSPAQQAANNGSIFGRIVGGLVNAGVDALTGNDLLGDIAGGYATGMVDNRLR